MQHHEGGDGSPSPYGYIPPPTNVAPSLPQPASGTVVASSPPPPSPTQAHPPGTSLEGLPAAGSGGCTVNDMLAGVGCGRSAGEEAGGSGHRWPQEETQALIRIRSEMDAAFRNAALKAPVWWEEVSSKLAELGYHRSAKKCKEKFENVDKYYRRTKEGRTGRQDGKSYRFFSQLEALHAAAPPQHQAMGTVHDPKPLAVAAMVPATVPWPGTILPDLSFSSNSESESDDDEFDDEEEASGGHGGSNQKMTALFERMMKQIMEKQDAMQRQLLQTLENREAERNAREEAWRRQEVARINHEWEERADAASRDAALTAFLQRVSVDGMSDLLPGSSTAAVPTAMPVHAPPPQPVVVPPAKAEEGWTGGESSLAAPRWPKEEVEALIQLRVEKGEKYQDVGPKGVMWEEISVGMQRIGYSRSSKRCKEKWENINKYYKRVKESKKRRPEDSKTCPYFHQLDYIYRKKHLAVRGSGSGAASVATMAAVMASEHENTQRELELEGKSSHDLDKAYIIGIGGENVHAPSAEAAAPATTVLHDSTVIVSATNKEAEGIEETEQSMQSQEVSKTPDKSDGDDKLEGNYTDEGHNDSNQVDKSNYKIEFQTPNGGGSSSSPAPAKVAAVATSSAPGSSSTFLAVQ